MACQTKNYYNEKIEQILSKMTVEEKVAQMQQLSMGATPENIFNEFNCFIFLSFFSLSIFASFVALGI